LEIGVLAVQGDFAEHIAVLRRLGVIARQVRLPRQIDGLDGLVIPGGESTVLGRLMSIYHLREPIKKMAQQGKSIWGTCAGMIMLAERISESDPEPLKLMNIDVHRNAFGRQIDSFEQDLAIKELGSSVFRAVFIRAPVVTRLGANVKVLASLNDGRPVAVQQGKMLATAFHPELTGDNRFHRHFLSII
jgi:5'-phosphate synthase pdxT subunit